MATGDLVSLDEAKAFIGETSTIRDLTLGPWIGGLSAFIRRYVDGPITTEALSDKLDGKGGTRIRLYNRPVLSVTTLAVDGVSIDVATLLTSGDLVFYEDGGLYYSGGFPVGVQNVSVGYTAGYGSTVPMDMQLAVLLILQQAAQTALLQQAVRGEYAYVFAPTKWPKDAKEIVDSYRRRL